jgi:lipopolysaccharide export LptBFGC system permease protein LptF
MTHLGNRLRRLAVRVFGVTTMERLIDPVLADLQTESVHAIGHGRVWESRWVRLVGYVALCKVVVIYMGERSMRTISDWNDDDHQAVSRIIGWSVAIMAAAMLVLLLPPLRMVANVAPPTVSRLTLMAYIVPQTLPIAVPLGLTLGILYGLRGRLVSRRSIGAVVAASIACSVILFVAMAWIIPSANQAFRVVSGRINATAGPNELTLRELSQRIDASRSAGLSTTQMGLNYHMRWALPCAALVLAFFALSLVTRRSNGRVLLGVAGIGALFGYYRLLFVGSKYALDGALSSITAVWLPNIVVVAVSLALLMLLPRRSVGAFRDHPHKQ